MDPEQPIQGRPVASPVPSPVLLAPRKRLPAANPGRPAVCGSDWAWFSSWHACSPARSPPASPVEGSVTSKGQGAPRFRAHLYNYQGQWRFVSFQFLTGVGPGAR